MRRTLVELSALAILIQSSLLASAFQSTRYPSRDFPSSTVLFGVREALRRTLSRPFSRSRSSSPLQPSQVPSLIAAQNVTQTKGLNSVATVEVEIIETRVDNETDNVAETNKTEIVVKVEPPPQAKPPLSRFLSNYSMSGSIYNLPPIDRQLSESEQEFRDILTHFMTYPARDILSLRDERLRIIFDGAVAGAENPEMYRAFEVLFEDLYPLRVAGRMIYRKLKESIQQSKQEQDKEVGLVVESTGLDLTSVDEARLNFLAVALKLNGGAYLTPDQLLKTGLTNTAVETLGFDSFEEFLHSVDPEYKDRLGFADIMTGLHQCATEECVLHHCNAADTVRQVVDELIEHPPNVTARDGKYEQYARKYDSMVEAFRGWEELLPAVNSEETVGRRQARVMDIVRGCFVGAKNERMVNALRVVYVDYKVLRLAGDIVFGIVSSIMNRRLKKSEAITR